MKTHIVTDNENGTVMCGRNPAPDLVTYGSGDEGDPELTDENVESGILCKTCFKAYLAEGR